MLGPDPLTLADLELDPAHRLHLRAALASPGLVVISSPQPALIRTLSAACLRERADASRVLYSVQPRPHPELEGCVYLEPNPVVGFFRAEALQAALKCRPDLLALDRISDGACAELLAVGAATRTTLGSTFVPGAARTLQRLLDLGVPAATLTEIELTVLAALSLPRLCPDCRVACPPPELAELEQRAPRAFAEGVLADWEHAWSRGEGCDTCVDTGCAGQATLFELLPFPKTTLDPPADAALPLLESALVLAKQGDLAFEQVWQWLALT